METWSLPTTTYLWHVWVTAHLVGIWGRSQVTISILLDEKSLVLRFSLISESANLKNFQVDVDDLTDFLSSFQPQSRRPQRRSPRRLPQRRPHQRRLWRRPHQRRRPPRARRRHELVWISLYNHFEQLMLFKIQFWLFHLFNVQLVSTLSINKIY